MLRALFRQPHLTVIQGEATEILVSSGRVAGVRTQDGGQIECPAVVVCTGVYLKSKIIIGDQMWDQGPQGLLPANRLSASLMDCGLTLRRFKTGTPARVDARSIDFDQMEVQNGDEPVTPFSFLTDTPPVNKAVCYLTWTNEQTHEIIRKNIHLAPMYSGKLHSTGARYCPSIEDKVIRFADKDRHQLFIEPEGLDYPEWYIQGMSSGLPREVQVAMYRSIRGLNRAVLTRLAYAIEYDCIDPTALRPTLECKQVRGLYGAGQFNGSSGYEEAAVQGFVAGVNAALKLLGREPFILSRSEGYIGALIDDLVTKGTNEPYRMMTSRSEYRLLHRQDNADERLAGKGFAIGLVSAERISAVKAKYSSVEEEIHRLENAHIGPSRRLAEVLAFLGTSAPASGTSLADLLRRPQVGYADIAEFDPERPVLPRAVTEQVEIRLKYEGYIRRQLKQIEEFGRMESRRIPEDIDYSKVAGLRLEAREKLSKIRPENFGRASRISGVSPADISVLMIYTEQNT
jgi:tRNA uridine 5-carboxymethylaminomethyl modification enzyme